VLGLAKKLGPLAAAATMLAAATMPTMQTPAHAGASLLVYTHLTKPEAAVVQGLADQWGKKTGNTVKVVVDGSAFQAFATLARSGHGPDVMFGLPDDNTGTFQAAGLLAPVPTGTFNAADYVPAAGPATTFKGQAYSVPLMLDTYALVYNKELVPTPPKTMDDLIKVAQKFPNTKGKNYGFLFDPTNFYFSYAFVRGFGGYVFKNSGSAYDTSDVGLANAGAVKAYGLFRDLVQKYKLIPQDIQNSQVPGGLFQSGKLGMWIDGDWDIATNQKALGSKFGAAVLPAVAAGMPSHPFAGVQVAFVSQFSNQKDLSFQFIKYMLPLISLPDFKVSGRIPALKSALASSTFQSDAVYSVYAKSALAGDALPNVPAMATVWTPAASAIDLVITGKKAPQDAATNLVNQIKQAIQAQQS